MQKPSLAEENCLVFELGPVGVYGYLVTCGEAPHDDGDASLTSSRLAPSRSKVVFLKSLL